MAMSIELDLEMLVMRIVNLGQQRFKREIEHDEMLEKAEAIGKELDSMFRDESAETTFEAVKFISDTVKRRFELVEDAFDVEEAFVVCTALLRVASESSGWMYILPAKTLLMEVRKSSVLVFANTPESQMIVANLIKGTIGGLRAVAREFEDEDTAVWCDDYIASFAG